MATYTSFVRPSGVDGATIRIDSLGRLQGNADMQPFGTGTGDGFPAIWYVDGNVVSSGDGRTWRSAFKTLTEGLAAAQAYQTTSGNRAWAHRSKVYCVGDKLTEDLVILAEKTDVIGVGSCNAGKKPCLVGNHVPITTTTGGCRFINWQFEEADNGIMWTLTSVSASIEFHNCTFSSRSAVATGGIRSTANYGFKVINCDFEAAGAAGGFSTACIELKTGVSDNQIFTGNRFGGGIGIVIDNGVTNTAGRIWIENNHFYNTTFAIDDNSDGGTGIAVVIENFAVSDCIVANVFDINLLLAIGNKTVGSDNALDVPISAA